MFTPRSGPLPALTFEVSADGVAFERVARRRPGRETEDLWWVNGHPEFVFEGPALSVVFDPRTVRAVRLTPIGASAPWTVTELMLHAPAQPPTAWPAMASTGDAGWAFRVLLTSKR